MLLQLTHNAVGLRSQRLALRDFDDARRQTFWCRLFGRLKGDHNQLLAFEALRQNLGVKCQCYRGLQIVPLNAIVSSEGRHGDFDGAFLPPTAARGIAESALTRPITGHLENEAADVFLALGRGATFLSTSIQRTW